MGASEHLPTEGRPTEHLLFAQHGWADNNRAMQRFGETIATPGTRVVAPDLGYVRTWLRIEPLIETTERVAADALAEHPEARILAVGHSMGGLIWIELLARHPEWLARTDRLVLIGCPVGGAALARILDPFGLSIARDLRVDRRALAEQVAAAIPTLSIVGDMLGPHDGTISHESARVPNARFVLVPSSSHAGLRQSPLVSLLTRSFMETVTPVQTDLEDIVQRLQAIPDIRPADQQLFRLARTAMLFSDGITIRRFDAMPGGLVFVADPEGQCVYAGYVPWAGRRDVQRVLNEIGAAHQDALLYPTPG